MVIRLGFTGSQDGMTILQRERVISVFNYIRGLGEDIIIHLGDCIGADEEAHSLSQGFITYGHPPLKTHKRAYCEYDFEAEPKDYLERDRDIVNESELLIATPKQSFNVKRSGTWYTIRYAESKIPVLIINPDGSMPKSLLLNWAMNRKSIDNK